MKVILAAPRGFCAGVIMAVDSLKQALRQFGPPVYVYHEIVHNRHVVERFRAEGAVFVDTVAEVPEGAVLLFSAHGVSPDVRRQARQRRLRTVDATCPLVTKVHREARRYAEAGYTILLIGHAGHDEVVGTMGEAPEAMVLVESEEQADRLEFPPGTRLAYLTQTTLSMDDTQRILARLRSRFPDLKGPTKEDICYATQNRQEAVRQLGSPTQLVLVVGSRNSSNSQRLREIAAAAGVPAHRIDGVDELQPEWFQGIERVLVTAGASAPEEVVQECLDYLQNEWGARVESHSLRTERLRFPLPRELAPGGKPPA